MKFKISFKTTMVIDCAPFEDLEELNNSFDVGSRCWSNQIYSELKELADEDYEKGRCSTCVLMEDLQAEEIIAES